MSFDASQARFIRKKHAQQGVDEQEQEEEREFGENLQKALDVYGNKNKKKDIESEVQYFGNMIEPFNMREQQDMGDIDQEGYFVFKRRNEYKDAWLQSIQEQNDMMVADKVKKRIKTEGVGWKGVYDDDKNQNGQIKQINEDENQNQNDEENENEEQEEEEVQNNQSEQQQANAMGLEPNQIKQLICELLPMNKSANAYIKDLKKKPKDPESKELHDKILELCNMYIEKTNQYDILTLKKQQLEIQVGEEEKSQEEEINWDEEKESSQKVQMRQEGQMVNNQNITGKNQNKMKMDNTPMKNQQQQYENDDIF